MFFLKLKHWQIFIILTIGIFTIPLAFIFDIINQLTSPQDTGIKTISVYIFIYSIHYTVYIFYFYLWNLLNCFNKFLKDDNENYVMNLLVVIAILFFTFIFNYLTALNLPFIMFTMVFFISALIILFTTLYTVYVLAKKMNELIFKRKVDISECFVDALLLVFIPIGVWIIQPKINQLVKNF